MISKTVGSYRGAASFENIFVNQKYSNLLQDWRCDSIMVGTAWVPPIDLDAQVACPEEAAPPGSGLAG